MKVLHHIDAKKIKNTANPRLKAPTISHLKHLFFFSTVCLLTVSACEKLFESALIGYCGPINEISVHGRTEILGAVPEAGAHSDGEFPTLTCKTCILCDMLL